MGETFIAIDDHGELIAKLIPLTTGSVWAVEFRAHEDLMKKTLTGLLNKASGDIEVDPAEFWDDALSAIERIESLLDEADSLARTVVKSCEVVRCVPLPPPMDVRFVPLPPLVVEQPPTPIWETEEDTPIRCSRTSPARHGARSTSQVSFADIDIVQVASVLCACARLFSSCSFCHSCLIVA